MNKSELKNKYFNKKMISDNILKIKDCLIKIMCIKNPYLRSSKVALWSTIYNVFLVVISLIWFIPILFFINNSNFNNAESFNCYYSFVITFSVIYIVDYLLRLWTSDRYYQTNYLRAFRKFFSNIFLNFQFISSLIVLILISACSVNIDGLIYFPESNFTNDYALVVFSVIFLFNFTFIISRITFETSNIESINRIKIILYGKRKSLLITVLIMLISWLTFSFIVFNLDKDVNSSMNNINDAMYFSFICMTTVGLGDIHPISQGAKIVTVFLSIFGVCFYGYVSATFVNIYVDFTNKKKEIRKEILDKRTQENEMNKLISNIEEMFLKNLYEAGVIKKDKYEKLIKSNEINVSQIPLGIEDYKNDLDNNKLFLNKNEMGIKITDINKIKEYMDSKWIVDLDDNSNNKKVVLYKANNILINTILERERFPILYSENFVDESIEKIIIYRSKPYKAAILELNISSCFTLDKENAWKLFSNLTMLNKNKYDYLYNKKEKISVLIIRDIVIYNNPKDLNQFGINTNLKIPKKIYLK